MPPKDCEGRAAYDFAFVERFPEHRGDFDSVCGKMETSPIVLDGEDGQRTFAVCRAHRLILVELRTRYLRPDAEVL